MVDKRNSEAGTDQAKLIKGHEMVYGTEGHICHSDSSCKHRSKYPGVILPFN
jgi:hypothetical protein